MLLIYKLLIILCIYFLFKAYFRIKYPFWSIQPVFQYYNLYYWCFPPGIINQSLPNKHKTYYDYSIQFSTFENLKQHEKEDFITLLQNHYLRSKEVDYVPTENAISSYLQNLESKSLVGLKYETKFLNNQTHKKLIGTITGKPLTCYLDNNKFNVNYVDFLCVHKKFRKKQVAPKLIHSYYVNQRNIEKTQVFLFKRESSKTAYVPLTSYLSYGFNLHYLKRPLKKYSILLAKDHLSYIYNEINNINTDFRCTIISSLSNIETLITNKIFFIYGILDNINIHALYIFQNNQTKIDGEFSVDCIGSYKNKSLKETIFYNGFLNALYDLKKTYKTLVLENIGHNHILIKNFIKKNTPLFSSQNSYYFYNFAYKPILSKDVFILH
jgi:hypothetical protein